MEGIAYSVLDVRCPFLANSRVWFQAIATTRDRLAGSRCERIVAGQLSVHVQAAGWGFVNDLFIRPSFRGKGIARELIARAQIWIEELKLTGAACAIREINGASLALFQSCGFSHCYSSESHEFDGDQLWLSWRPGK